MSVTILRGTRACRLLGGPYGKTDGEVVPEVNGSAPAFLSFGDNGGFVYRHDGTDNVHGRPRERYVYDPRVSPAHRLILQAEREAIQQVADQQGITVAQVLAEADARHKAAAGRPHPAQQMAEEAARLGVTIQALLAQMEAEDNG